MDVEPRYTLLTLLTLLTIMTLFTLFILFKLLYIAETVACMPIFIMLGKVRTLMEWADGVMSKMLAG